MHLSCDYNVLEFILNKNSFRFDLHNDYMYNKNLELSLGCVFISNVVFIHFIKVKKVRCKTKVLERKGLGN
jgi:hypothetical protein